MRKSRQFSYHLWATLDVKWQSYTSERGGLAVPPLPRERFLSSHTPRGRTRRQRDSSRRGRARSPWARGSNALRPGCHAQQGHEPFLSTAPQDLDTPCTQVNLVGGAERQSQPSEAGIGCQAVHEGIELGRLYLSLTERTWLQASWTDPLLSVDSEEPARSAPLSPNGCFRKNHLHSRKPGQVRASVHPESVPIHGGRPWVRRGEFSGRRWHRERGSVDRESRLKHSKIMFVSRMPHSFLF